MVLMLGEYVWFSNNYIRFWGGLRGLDVAVGLLVGSVVWPLMNCQHTASSIFKRGQW